MAEEKFHLVSSYAPTGDQPQAIAQLVEGVERLLLPDPVGRHRQRQDLHDGERHRPSATAHAGAGP